MYSVGLLGFPGGSDGKEPACTAGDLGSSPELGQSLEEGSSYPSSILAWRIPWRDELVHGQRTEGYSPWGHKELDMTE